MNADEIKTDFPHAITEYEDWQITLRDGCVLSARVWMPEIDQPIPAILEFLPYRKRDGTAVRDELTHPYFAGHGFACFRVDMRGNGESEGLMHDEYSEEELSDALEVIEYLAGANWSNGRVGMMGISWGGFNALQAAARGPDALKAIITLCSSVDRYADDIHCKGGCLLNENLGWGATMWSYSSRPPDPALRENWREIWLERLSAEPFLPALWLAHQSRDEYWRRASVCEDYSAIKAAVLAVGGWGDGYKNAVGALIENLEAPAKGIIGPWVHKYPHFAVPEPRIGFLQEALRFWDYWLKDIETGIMEEPDLRLFVMEGEAPKTHYERRSGRFIGIDRYPRAGPRAGAKSGMALGYEGEPRALSCPQNTGSGSGEYCAIWLGPEMPGDQREDDARSILVDGKPSEGTVDIVGRPICKFVIDAPKGFGKIAIRLCDVAPDGASARISYGLCNLAQLAGESTRVAGEVELDAIAYQLAGGHHLRLAISDAYWPLIWPAPDHAELTLISAKLEIPILEAGAKPVTFSPPQSAPPLSQEEIRPPDHLRENAIDPVSGRQVLRIVDDFGKFRNSHHGLITGSIARENWSIHPGDPNSAKGECHWTQELERGEHRLRTEAKCAMWSDHENFYLCARMEAYEGDAQVFERDEEFRVKRDGQ